MSLIIDCFDGKIVSWKIGEVPNSKLVNDMLKNAISQLKENETPILHTDRGCHYRWKEWINLLKEAKISRSMSKKMGSLQNSYSFLYWAGVGYFIFLSGLSLLSS